MIKDGDTVTVYKEIFGARGQTYETRGVSGILKVFRPLVPKHHTRLQMHDSSRRKYYRNRNYFDPFLRR